MRKIMLGSVAVAALSFGIVGAMAQQSEKMSPGAGASPAMKSEAPASKAATPATDGATKFTPTERRSASESAEKPASAADKSDSKAPASTAAESSPAKSERSDMKKTGDAAPASEKPATRTGEKASATPKSSAASDSKADPAAKTDTKAAADGKSRTDDATKSRADTNMTGANKTAAAPPANIDSQKQDRIRTALSSTKVENVTNVNFNVSVGSTIPARVRFHSLPTEIVDIVPEYRGYDYVMVNDEIVIVEPRTRKIVYTMSEGRSSSTGSMRERPVDCK